MKWNHWIIVIMLLLLISLGGMAAFNTTIGQQQAELVAAQKETDQLAAEIYWMAIKNRPLPFHHPIEPIWVSSGCGYRQDPMGGATESLHQGIDLVAPIGTPVKAVRDGIIREHWVPPDGGRWKGHPVMGGLLVIDHGEFFGKYGHLSKTFVHEGEHVKMGQIIGLVGDTGITTGSHLHFEVVVDPLKYLEGQ